jgi:MoxR-like ATPase
MSDSVVDRLHREVVAPIQQRFVGRDEVVDLIALTVVAGEHLFLHGPPGTAKSALIRTFARAVRGSYFEYMLTRFTEPNEIFGPIDIAKLRDGKVITVTTGMLPEAEFAFLDELFNANSAILSSLLTILNERVFRRGLETHHLPLLSLFSASNHLPEEDALKALFDRFLLRCHVENLNRDAMPKLLQAGWELEQTPLAESSISADDMRRLAKSIFKVDLSGALEAYREAVHKVRDLGIAFSDRRAVKVQKLLAASALLCGRTAAQPSDLWVLRYVWDREEQIESLAALVNGILEQHTKDAKKHPLAAVRKAVDAEELARQIAALEKDLGPSLTLSQIARLKDRLATLSDQIAWIRDDKVRQHLSESVRKCAQKLG